MPPCRKSETPAHPCYAAGTCPLLLRQHHFAFVQASKGCWKLAGLCTEVEVVFQAQNLEKQSASLRQFLKRHENKVRPPALAPPSLALHHCNAHLLHRMLVHNAPTQGQHFSDIPHAGMYALLIPA